MSDYIEVDFLSVECDKSGDAIAIRYRQEDKVFVHIVDAGFKDSAEHMIEFIGKYYGRPSYIDNVVVTHGDQDHASGIRAIIERYKNNIGRLWMLRPWMYAAELVAHTNFDSVSKLQRHLRSQYAILAEIEELALSHGVRIEEPFQGAQIGVFTVLSPSKAYYLNLILNSSKADIAEDARASIVRSGIFEAISESEGTRYGKHPWGHEIFPEEDTPDENNTSVMQYADFCQTRLLLTGDAGRGAFALAMDYLKSQGIRMPGLNLFQVPHHGSRHNVKTEMLNDWLGPILPERPAKGHFTAIVSSAEKDKDHPRKCVVRAMMHRGANYAETEGKNTRFNSASAPTRDGWGPASPLPYPEDQEE
jgi:hypothetical protein